MSRPSRRPFKVQARAIGLMKVPWWGWHSCLRRPSVWLLVISVLFQQALGQGDIEHVSEADYYRMVPAYSGGLDVSLRASSQGATSSPPYGYRSGSASTTNSCQRVRTVPASLRTAHGMKPNGLSNFYQKYTETYGIPVLSSQNVSDSALKRACYDLRFLLAGNAAVRQSFYRLYGHVAVIGLNEGTTSIPEHSHLAEWWNQRARGLGATPDQPVSSGGEENLLCYQNDRYRAQDIFLHETAHGVHLLGAAFGIPGWDKRLRNQYTRAKAKGLWANTYSMSSPEEYFAEGTQSYFNVNSYSPTPDGVRGPINTRSKLQSYDPDLYSLIREIFPCDNAFLKRCQSNRAKENSQHLQMDCDSGGGGGTGGGGDCVDKNPNCAQWANANECNINPGYMHLYCKKSCIQCPGKCQDRNQHCTAWADTGECSHSAAYMLVNCPVSCDQC